jgi:hypothetical protein
MREVSMADESRTQNGATGRGGQDGHEARAEDHNRQRIADANQKQPGEHTESSGVESVDRLNEGARQVLGDAQVDYDEAEIYMEPDDAVLAAEAALHGDRISRNPDGTHEVTSVAPGPADDPAGGWADLPAGRTGDGALTETVEETEARQAQQRQADQRDEEEQSRE